MKRKLRKLFAALLVVSFGSGALYASSDAKAKAGLSGDYDVVILSVSQ